MKVARVQIYGASGQKSAQLGGILSKLRVLPANPGGGIDVIIKADGDTLVTLTGLTANRTLYIQVPVNNETGGETAFSVFPSVNQLSVSLANAEANTTLTVEGYYVE